MRLRGRVKKWLYGSCPGFRGSFPYFGTRVYFPTNSHLFHRACASGIYEFELVHLISRLVRPGTTYFDVGANIGLLAVPILSGRSDCKVVSFEPSPNSLPHLNRTAKESRYGDRWSVVGTMVGAHTGESEFFLAAASEGAFDGAQPTGRVVTESQVKVGVTTIDEEWKRLGRPFVSVIKIDVEGGEKFVLDGAAACIAHSHPFILIEWNETNLKAYGIELASLFAISSKLDYTVMRVPNLEPVRNVGELRALAALGVENFLLSPCGSAPKGCAP